MGGPSIKFPEPTQQEQELQMEQLGLLRSQKDMLSRQLREQNLLLPFLYGNVGLTPVFENGEIVRFDRDPEFDKDQQQQTDIARAFADRTQQALRGELPVSGGTMRDLATQQRDLEASLAAQLGPGAMGSTAGQQAMADFMQRKSDIVSAARKGEIDFSQQHMLAQEAANLGGRRDAQQRTQALSEILGGTAQGFGGVSGGMAGILQNLMQNRMGQFQASQFNAQNQGNPMAMFGSLAGLLGGSFLGPLGAGAGSALGKSLFSF